MIYELWEAAKEVALTCAVLYCLWLAAEWVFNKVLGGLDYE